MLEQIAEWTTIVANVVLSVTAIITVLMLRK